MTRWKSLMLAGALFGWPALCSAQGVSEMGKGKPVMPASGSSMPMTSGSMTTMPSIAACPDVTGQPVADGIKPVGLFTSSCNPCGPIIGGCTPPDCEIETSGSCGWFTTGELMYLKMRRNDPVALFRLTTGTPGIDAQDVGALEGYTSTYDFAFRVGGGYLASSGWIFSANYTRFKDTSEAQRFVSDDPSGNTSILYVGPGVLGSAYQFTQGVLESQWQFDYQTIDVQAGAVYSPSSCLDMIVSGGLRYADLSQDYGTIIQDDIAQTIQTENLTTTLRGGGPRFGGEARLYAWTGRTSSLMLYGRGFSSVIIANRKESTVYVNPNTVQTVTYSREELLPMLEVGAGAEMSFFRGHVILGAGYEWNYLFEAGSSNVDYANNARFNRHVNLSLEGFTLRASVLW